MGLKRMWRKFRRHTGNPARQNVRPLTRKAIHDADVIVTTNEVTDRHGTGVILSRIFGRSPNILSIRSTDLYREHNLGAAQLRFSQDSLSRPQSFERVLFALNGASVRRVLCVPFLPDELITAIALKELFGVPLCTFLMDDNNVFSRGIPDELMREALEKSDLRLAISPEMRDAYESKYHLKFFVVPPVVAPAALQSSPRVPAGASVERRTGVLVGSIWSQKWLEQLRQTTREAGLQLHWFGNARAPWLKVTPEQLRADGIIDCGFLPEAELTRRIQDYPYAVIPSGSLDEKDDRPEIARLSLPTRLPYLLAAANIPMLVLGHPDSGAAHFLERFEVGLVAPYEGAKMREAVLEICRPQKQLAFRRRAAARSGLFSAEGLADWIWQSLERGEPVDDRFESAFRRDPTDLVQFVEAPVPKDLQADHVLTYHALRRLKKHGFKPDFVLDVGASTAVWSDMAHRLFPQARFLLIEPLHEQYARQCNWFFKKHPQFEYLPVAVSDSAGEVELSVSEDLYGSSLFNPSDFRHYDKLKVPVETLDQIAAEHALVGRGLLKMDVQFAEHLVLRGARELLPRVDALLVELSLVRYASQPMLFFEMCEWLRGLGFRYYEDVGGWRCPVDGTALQKDVVFVREDLFPYVGTESKADEAVAVEAEANAAVKELVEAI